MSEQQLDVILGQHSEATKQLLVQGQAKEVEEKRRALGIDTELRVLVTDEKLLEFLAAREVDLPLVFEKGEKGTRRDYHPVLRITPDGAVICSDWGDNESTEVFRLKNVRDEGQAQKLMIDKDDLETYADFISGDGFAFVRVGGNSTWGSKGDFLANKYSWAEPFKGVTAKNLEQQAKAQIEKIGAGKK